MRGACAARGGVGVLVSIIDYGKLLVIHYFEMFFSTSLSLPLFLSFFFPILFSLCISVWEVPVEMSSSS